MSGVLSIFQNFIWEPIIAAIVGCLLTIFIPKIAKLFQRKINKHADVINIAGEWNSFFHEEDIVQSEKVNLIQSGNYISGTITLQEKLYNFNGEFKNNILTGNYRSKNEKKYESGTITVRRINEDLMSGYCTFVYNDIQIYNSPYVLSRKNDHEVKKGTYSFCNSCVGKFDCCCNCKEIDMPILLPNEAQNLSIVSRQPIEAFAKKLTSNLYQMKRDDNDNEEKGCIFFKNNSCSIYDNRPIDCRLFPFDFKEIEGKYWLIYYDNIKVCRALPTDKYKISCCAHNIRPLLDMVLPYMSECSDPIFCKRLENQSFQKLFPINSIRDDKINA